MTDFNPGIQVQKQRCYSCIYRKDSVLNLTQLEDEVRDPRMGFWGYRACHHARSGQVCCRGFWDHHKDEFQLGQVAQRLNAVTFVEVDDLYDTEEDVMPERKLVDLKVTYGHHTEKAVLINDTIWVPLSRCETDPKDLDGVKRGAEIEITLYEDLAMEKGLI